MSCNKKILYIDMDNVLVDFQSGIDQLDSETKKEYEGRLDEVPNIFQKMLPMKGAINAVCKLSSIYDVYILSTAPWENDTAWSDKLNWVKKYLGQSMHKRLILSHNKNLNAGDFIVDDRKKNGVDKFIGEHLHFGQKPFENWDKVLRYLHLKVLREYNDTLDHIEMLDNLPTEFNSILSAYKIYLGFGWTKEKSLEQSGLKLFIEKNPEYKERIDKE